MILDVYLPTLKILRLLIILHLSLVGRLELFFFLEQVFSTLTLFALKKKIAGDGFKSTCQCRGHRFNSRSGKSPQAVRQLSWSPRLWSPSSGAHLLQLLKPPSPQAPGLHNRRSHRSEQTLLTASRESLRAAVRTQHRPK